MKNYFFFKSFLFLIICSLILPFCCNAEEGNTETIKVYGLILEVKDSLAEINIGLSSSVAEGSKGKVYTVQKLDDGKEKIVRSWSHIIMDIITKSNTKLGPQDIIEPGLQTYVSTGGNIIITRINEFNESKNESIPYDTIYNGSSSIPFGESRVTQAGLNGTMKKTYHVVFRNGVEVTRDLIGSVVTRSEQNKIITAGVLIGRANFGYYSGMVTSFYRGMTGRYLLVTNLDNGRQVKVRIIGSGPFNGPLMDMGTEPFTAIGGSLSSGYIPQVSVQLVE